MHYLESPFTEAFFFLFILCNNRDNGLKMRRKLFRDKSITWCHEQGNFLLWKTMGSPLSGIIHECNNQTQATKYHRVKHLGPNGTEIRVSRGLCKNYADWDKIYRAETILRKIKQNFRKIVSLDLWYNLEHNIPVVLESWSKMSKFQLIYFYFLIFFKKCKKKKKTDQTENAD